MAPATDLPEELLAVLPSDPFEQLDVARRITSIALANRVSALEDEVASLRRELDDKDDVVIELGERVEALDSTLTDLSDQLARANEEKASLASENVSLSSTVKKLNRDVAKLEAFRKTLVQSLQEEDENSKTGASRTLPKQTTDSSSSSAGSLPGGNEEGIKLTPVRTRVSETTSTISDDMDSVNTDGATSRGLSHGFLPTPSQSVTPRLTPPDSPKQHSTSVSPRLAIPISPRRHSTSFSNARSAFEERSPSESFSFRSQTERSRVDPERNRVDGKEFFRQVRSRLSYEKFSAFLSNVKEMNSRKQTREETLRKAGEMFGEDNKDLYAIFEGLITRNLH